MPKKKAEVVDAETFEAVADPAPMTEEELQEEEKETAIDTAEAINQYFDEADSEDAVPTPAEPSAVADVGSAQKTDEKKSDEQNERPARRRGTKMEQAAENASSRREVIEDARRREKEREAAASSKEGTLSGYMQLRAAMEGRIILTGTIASSEQYRVVIDRESGAVVTKYALCVILDQKYKVHIQLDDMFNESPFDMSLVNFKTREGREEYSRRQSRLADSFVGAEIPFKIIAVDGKPNSKPSEIAIRGSRKAALADLVRINYENNHRINEGDILKVPIHAVGNHAVRVNVGGVDASIGVARLSFDFMPLVKARYSVGDKLRVKVTRINRDKDGHVTSVQVGATDAILEDAKDRSYLVSEGATVHGRISNMIVTGNDRVRAVGMLENSELPMLIDEFKPYAFGEPPKVGDTVKLTVKGFASSGFVKCVYRGNVGAVNYANQFIM